MALYIAQNYLDMVKTSLWLIFATLGDAIRNLHHLTSTIRLDYFRFVSDYDQTLYYAAQQVEAGIKDYYPQTVLVRRNNGYAM